MKKLILWILLLCLGLAGCNLSPVVEEPVSSPALPTPEIPGTESMSGSAVFVPVERTDVPVLTTSDGSFPMILGSAAAVPAKTFLGAFCSDPVYGDLDGDGETELVYRCPGPTSGLWTEAICVYGLEQGWPVLKGCTIYNLAQMGDFGLEQLGKQVILRCTPQKWDKAKKCYVNKETLRLPVTLAEGKVLVNGGELPEGLQVWGSFLWRCCGSSFLALRQQVGDEALLNDMNCVVWQVPVILALDSEPAGKEILQTWVAVTDNSVTVTGFLVFEEQETGVSCVFREGVEPIPAVEDPEAFLGLTRPELTERLGECHFTMGLGSLVSSSSAVTHFPSCWFTEDGKLLLVESRGTAKDASLWDMTAGVPFLETNVVTVHQEAIPTRIENPERWEAFLAAAERGVADELTLRLVYDRKDTFDVHLRFDGQVYRLTDGSRDTVCESLIVDEESDPPPGAAYRRAVHYLISDDPNMTWERYLSSIVSSSVPLDGFPATCALFSVLE